VAQVAANPAPESGGGNIDASKVNAQDCTAQTAGMPSAGGGWWADQQGLISPTLLVLVMLALGTGALWNWGSRRTPGVSDDQSPDA
jgi:hypothetical protein